VGRDTLEDLDRMVEILLNAPIGVNRGLPMGTQDLDGFVGTERGEGLFHGCDVYGFDGTIYIH